MQTWDHVAWRRRWGDHFPAVCLARSCSCGETVPLRYEPERSICHSAVSLRLAFGHLLDLCVGYGGQEDRLLRLPGWWKYVAGSTKVTRGSGLAAREACWVSQGCSHVPFVDPVVPCSGDAYACTGRTGMLSVVTQRRWAIYLRIVHGAIAACRVGQGT